MNRNRVAARGPPNDRQASERGRYLPLPERPDRHTDGGQLLGLKPILGSGLIVGVFLAIILNLVFRIGISQSGKLRLDEPNAAQQVARFLEDCGAAWGARRDVITRTGMAVGEALEALLEARFITAPPLLTAVFDEYSLILTLDYQGSALPVADAQPVDWHALMEKTDGSEEIDQVMKAVSSNIIRNLAERIESGEHKGQARLRLFFEY